MSSAMQMLEQAPLPAIVEALGTAIARAQLNMDRYLAQSVALMASTKPGEGVMLAGERRSLLELGFTPSFYHFQQATITARVAFSVVESREFSVGAGMSAGYPGIFSASVNASYTNKYSFHAEGSSEIRTTIVSLPPPPRLSELLAGMAGEDNR